MKVTLFVPVLNEIDGVRVIMPRVRREWVDEVLVVDGKSTDGTREYMEQAGYRVIVQRAPGVRAAWWEGFEAATGDVIIPFSPDNNSLPEVIPVLVEKMREGYDVVIASRYKGGVISEDDSLLSRAANLGFTRIINILYGAAYTDALGMYKAFRKELLKSLELEKLKDEVFEILLAVRAAKRRCRVCEVAAPEPPRIGGEDSRAWPGWRGRLRGAGLILRCILREI